MNENRWNMNFNEMGKPYENQWELMADYMALLDLRIYYLYKYHAWVGPDNSMQNMLGLAVSRAEFEMNLAKAVDSVIGVNLKSEEIADIQSINGYFIERLKHTCIHHNEFPIVQLIKKFSMDYFTGNCLLLAFAVQLDKKYEKIFAFLQDDITKKLPTSETAIKLFALPGEMSANYFHYFTGKSVLTRFIFKLFEENDTLFNTKICLRERLIDYLIGNDTRFESGFIELFNGEEGPQEFEINKFTSHYIDSILPSWPRNQSGIHKGLQWIEQLETPLEVRSGIQSNTQSKMQSEIESANKSMTQSKLHNEKHEIVLIFITGNKGSGRKFQVRQAVCRKNGKCLFVNVKSLLEASGSMSVKIHEIICEAVLNDAYLCFTGFDPFMEENSQKELYDFIITLSQNSEYLPGAVFFTSDKTWKDLNLPKNFIKADIQLEPLDENMRLNVWTYFTRDKKLEDDIDLEELASKFRFTPGQIHNAVEQAAGLCEIYGRKAIDINTLHKSCYDQVIMQLGTLATKVKPAYNWDDLVLPDDQVALLQDACTHVKFRHTVYQNWGFDKRVSYGKGLSMLFSGPPGTGKTMAAQVIANQLHMEIYKIQLSQIVSKYIGETEKNLRQVFEEAKNANCILFFDETDALFGKRSEVKDSHDRHANIEIAYLLQQMEEYDGVIIMATNLLQNIDNAFMRRINFVISFPFPDAATRRKLWDKMLSTGAPIAEDVDLDFMAEQFKIAGGNIKNIVIHAAFLAAAEKLPISMKHLLKSTVNEQRKSNIIIVKEDLKEYSDLVFLR